MAETVERGGTRTDGLRARLRQLGPAFVLAAVVVGPGSLTLSTIAGGSYGYALLWVPVVATAFMIAYTLMAARVGLVTGDTLFEATREKYGDGVAKVGGVFGFLTILAFQAGNNAGIGFASEALFGGSVKLWAGVFTLFAVGFLFLPSLYDKVELLVKLVVGLLVVAFFGTLALVGADPGGVAAGLMPSFPGKPEESVLLALGMAATNFSIAAAVYQTHIMKEKEWGPERLADESFDTVLGIALLGLIVMAILMTSAAVIYAGGGEQAFSAQGMAEQLEPFAGPGAFYLFTVGFFFASLSSLVVNAIIGATLLADGFDRDPSMEGRPVKLLSVVAMLIGLGVVLVAGRSPTELLTIAQALAVVAFPMLGFLVLDIARDEKLMGEHANGTALNVLGVLGYLVIVGIVVNYLLSVLGTFGVTVF